MAISNDYWGQFQPIQGSMVNEPSGAMNFATQPVGGPVQGPLVNPEGPGGISGAPPASGNPMDREFIKQQLISQVYGPLGITPGARGSGPADIDYYVDQILASGGWKNGGAGQDNIGYWSNRIKSDAGGGAGGGAAGGSLGGLGMGALAQPYGKEFSAPNMIDDPGYQFRLSEGLKGIERGAASRGTLLTGGTLKALAGYNSGLASQEYGNAYDRALSTFGTNYNVSRNDKNDIFGRFNSLANLGLNAAS